MEKILLDTDIGGDIDDAICLAYLLKEPRCDLLGITTVCGERRSGRRSRTRSAGRGEANPDRGRARHDLAADPGLPDAGRRGRPWIAGRTTPFAKGDAPAFLCQKIRENPHEVVLIAIGNLTNVATLFTDYPDSVGLLKGLFVMNGYFGAEPLPDPYYNWNAWADPLAAKIAFAARPAVFRAVPLEITDRLTIEARQAEVLLRADSDLMRAVFSFGNAWLESSEKLTLHDPLAAGLRLSPGGLPVCARQGGGGDGAGARHGRHSLHALRGWECGDRVRGGPGAILPDLARHAPRGAGEVPPALPPARGPPGQVPGGHRGGVARKPGTP